MNAQNNGAQPAQAETLNTSDQIAVRKSKRERLLARGEEAYPVSVPITHSIAQIRELSADLTEPGDAGLTDVGVSGRVMFQRNTGKL